MTGGIAILLMIIVVLVVGGIGLALYGTGGLDRWGDGGDMRDMERRR